MDKKAFLEFSENALNNSIIPNLSTFIRIPNTSPAFDKEWDTNNYLLNAATHLYSYASSLQLNDASINLYKDTNHTPLIYIKISSNIPNNTKSILFYGHFDKQPANVGWDKNKGATIPVIENNRLYGRGAADDGYSIFAALNSIKLCQNFKLKYPDIYIIIEGSEESTDIELHYYFDKLLNENKIPSDLSLFVCLDNGCLDYDRLWVTSSLRGYAGLDVKIQTLNQDLSDNKNYSGIVPDNFFILKEILNNIQNNKTGEILIEECKIPEEKIPENRLNEMKRVANILKDTYTKDFPLYENTKPLSDDVYTLILNKGWKPSMNLCGIDGINIERFSNKLNKEIYLNLSMRLPPLIDSKTAVEAMSEKILEKKYFNCNIETSNFDYSDGWNLINFSERIRNILNNSSKIFFENEIEFLSEGGSIPFVNYLQTKLTETEIVCTGVCGIDSNEHGPNESINLIALKKFICCLAYLIIEF